MTKQTTTIPISSIILDESIYPRKEINHRRVGMFAEHIRDGFTFDPIEVEPVPENPANIASSMGRTGGAPTSQRGSQK